MVGMGSYILMGAIALIGSIVQARLKSKFAKYSKLTLQNGLSGKEIAEKMLADNNIYDVKVISVKGRLTDHYNPQDKTVNLSEAVYGEKNAAAAAVSAHECGHAIQHATNYYWLNFRSKMVPTVNISNRMAQFVLIGGIIMVNSFPQLLLIGIALFTASVIFSFITLPVEYDASNRALAWLHGKNMLTPQEQDGAKDALKWAARTYVVAAVASLITLLYYVMVYINRR
ncbi:MAG: zinc metallopeptidase [Flavobacteriaceae bacterium]|nr:zinc metallopeptidase [Flavobacteriaceae bacterium]